jgi:ribosomal protein S18 acetylase RimI-like enzyme
VHEMTKVAGSTLYYLMDPLPLIRKAAIADVSILSDFAGRAFFDAYSGTMNDEDIRSYVKKSFSLEALREQLSSFGSIFHIALVEGQMAGYTKLRWDRIRDELAGQRSIELERIYVDGRNYRNGMGTLLFNHAKEFARSNRYNLIWLAVWQKNQRAISFYQKAGMEIFGVQHFTVGTIVNDDFVLKLAI